VEETGGVIGVGVADGEVWVVFAQILLYTLIDFDDELASGYEVFNADSDLLPPWTALGIVWERDLAVAGSRIKGRGGDDTRLELQREHSVCGIIEEGVCGVSERSVVGDIEEEGVIPQNAVGRLKLQVEAKELEHDALVLQNQIPPLPVIFRLLVDNHIGLLHGNAAARHDKVLHSAHGLVNLECDEERHCRDDLWMHQVPSLFRILPA